MSTEFPDQSKWSTSNLSYTTTDAFVNVIDGFNSDGAITLTVKLCNGGAQTAAYEIWMDDCQSLVTSEASGTVVAGATAVIPLPYIVESLTIKVKSNAAGVPTTLFDTKVNGR